MLRAQPDLQMILMVGIQGALRDDPLFNMPTTNREVSFELLVSAQNDIGWDHLLRGRFSHHWVQIQQNHIDHEDEVSSKKFTGQRWLKQVLNHLWTHLHLAWKLRNANMHGIAVVALCAAAAKLDCLDRQLFEMPLTARLLLKSHEQKAWLNVNTPTVRQATAQAADKKQKTQRDIRAFLILPLAHPTAPHPPAAQINGQPIPMLRDGQSLITWCCVPLHLHLHLLSKNACVFSLERPHHHNFADSATDLGRLFLLGVGAEERDDAKQSFVIVV